LDKKIRLGIVKNRLNDIWFGGRGSAGGDICPEYQDEFNSLLKESLDLETELNREHKE